MEFAVTYVASVLQILTTDCIGFGHVPEAIKALCKMATANATTNFSQCLDSLRHSNGSVTITT